MRGGQFASFRALLAAADRAQLLRVPDTPAAARPGRRRPGVSCFRMPLIPPKEENSRCDCPD
jgi:hypothetical protein